MLRGIHGDRQRYIETYWSRVPGMYLAGDGARRDERGYFWIMGRIDDVINVSGHRLGTMESSRRWSRTSRSSRPRSSACRTRSRARASPRS
jgi:acyl-coenzyme A synthetase/AMP-(fatty) acid ligase